MSKPDINCDESSVPAYELPDPLTCEDGRPVTDADAWREVRRPEILDLFERHVYGRMPTRRIEMHVERRDESRDALDGKAVRKQYEVRFAEAPRPRMDLLVYLPVDVDAPAPVFLGLNFFGNHTIHADPGIFISDQWMREREDAGVADHRATEAGRGVSAHRWPVEEILARGYGVATAYCGDLDPDVDDGFGNGVHPLFDEHTGGSRPADAWGTIGAWAWGLSRAMDVLCDDPDVNRQRVGVIGHSRLGKTALWAGACDERFAMAISNNSGCGGAAIGRRRFGETIRAINEAFPHWFCGRFKEFVDREDELPVDQHMLISLIAPRPVYVASAAEDSWADPKGEFLGLKRAEGVYRLLGAGGLGVDEMPPVSEPVRGPAMGYHVRPGGHGVTAWDWQRFMDFADAAWSGGGG